ncbi:MAG: hypothetical protein L0H65_06850, partial [Pseudorhodobacter sp.]|nr:hypothetical protein [Pseudorhodobacter sp.]
MSEGYSTSSGAVIWGGATMVAVALHLVLVEQGFAAYRAQNEVPKQVTIPEVEIMAIASSVAGQDRAPEIIAAVQSQRLTARSDVADLAAQSSAEVLKAASGMTATHVSAAGVSAATVSVARIAANATDAATVASDAAIVTRPAALAPQTVTPTRAQTSTVALVRPPASVAQPPVSAPGLETAPVAVLPVGTVAQRPVVAAVTAPVTTVAPARVSTPRVASVQAVTPMTTTATTSLAAVSLAPTAVAANGQAEITTVAALPTLPPPPEVAAREGIAAPTPVQTPQENKQTYKSVLDVLATLPKTPCFAALPTLSEDSTFQLEAFALSRADLAAFSDALSGKVRTLPNTTMKPISAAQCAAVAFVAEGPAYPRFNLFFDVPKRVIQSGEALEGRIGNTSGGFLSFLVIDDEGVVQDLAGYLQFLRGGARFRIPLSLTG